MPPWLKGRQSKFGRGGKKHDYIPAPNSGGYAILVGMLKAEQNEFIKNFTKQQVLDFCIRYSQANQKDQSKIWASMKGLVDRSLVGRQISRDPMYFLNDEGRELAIKLTSLTEGGATDTDSNLPETHDEASNSNSQPMYMLSSQSSQSNSNFPTYQHTEQNATFELKAGTFEVILIVDQREKIDIVSLEGSMRTETRTLACGDFLWIARPRGIQPNDKTKDLVLDYVIERKTLNDLSSSIADGRFEQQKQRLLNCGVRRPVYLIEDCANLRTMITSSGLAQAAVNILTHDGIDVERVKNVAHSNDYLISMTKCIEKLYSAKDLKSCDQERLKSSDCSPFEFMTFSEFQTKGAKITNWTVREMFAKHLIQITGMSDKRVAVIIKQYPTLSALVRAYQKCSDEREKCDLLAKLKIPDSNRTIGPAISKRVYACYGMPVDLFEN